MYKGNKNSSNLSIIVCSAIIITMGRISYLKSSDMMVAFSLILAMIFSCIISAEDLLPFMVCVLPANRLLTYGSISAPTIIMLVALFRVCEKLKKIPKEIFIFCLLLIGYSFLVMLNTQNVFFDAMKVIVLLLFMYEYIDVNDIKYSHYRYTLFCAVGCILASIITMALGYSSVIAKSRFTFTANGENVLGILCAIMAINLFVVLLEEKNASRFMIIALVVILSGIGFMTGSRSFILALGLGIAGIIVMLILRLQIEKTLKILAVIFVGGIGAIVLIKTSEFANKYWNSVMYRVTKLQSGDVSNGRYELWSQYLDVFKKYPRYLWFGGVTIGTDNIQYVAHNMIIEQIAAYGIIGSIILVSMYLAIFRLIKYESVSDCRWHSFKIVPLGVLLIVSMVSHTLLGVTQTTMLFICFLALLDNSHKNVMEV